MQLFIHTFNKAQQKPVFLHATISLKALSIKKAHSKLFRMDTEQVFARELFDCRTHLKQLRLLQ